MATYVMIDKIILMITKPVAMRFLKLMTVILIITMMVTIMIILMIR